MESLVFTIHEASREILYVKKGKFFAIQLTTDEDVTCCLTQFKDSKCCCLDIFNLLCYKRRCGELHVINFDDMLKRLEKLNECVINKEKDQGKTLGIVIFWYILPVIVV